MQLTKLTPARIVVLAVSTVLLPVQTDAHAQTRTQNGATAGGLAGAVIGGIIGHQNDEVPEGALIGGAVGAIAGGLLGRNQDNELQRQRYQYQQAYYAQQQQRYVQQQTVVQSGVSTNDVINMSRSGLSEPLIINQLHSRGVQRRLAVSEIISLHQQGVNDNIITAMQQAPLATELATSRSTIVNPPVQQTVQQPVVVQQPVYQPNVIVREPVIYSRPPVVVERVYHPPVRHYHHPRSYRSAGASFRIGF